MHSRALKRYFSQQFLLTSSRRLVQSQNIIESPSDKRYRKNLSPDRVSILSHLKLNCKIQSLSTNYIGCNRKLHISSTFRLRTIFTINILSLCRTIWNHFPYLSPSCTSNVQSLINSKILFYQHICINASHCRHRTINKYKNTNSQYFKNQTGKRIGKGIGWMGHRFNSGWTGFEPWCHNYIKKNNIK